MSRRDWCRSSFPTDGCGWVVTTTKAPYRRNHEEVRRAGGIYRSKDYALRRVRRETTTASLVVWDEAAAQVFFDRALKYHALDRDSIRDLMHYFGTEVSRKFMRRNNDG